MRIKTVFISQLIVLFLYPCFSQDSYRVGFSSTSLEPDDQFVSLTLAGYAAPWEGRFTLHWKEKGTMPAYLGITGGESHLFFVDVQSLYRSSSKNTSRWEKIGDATGIRQIAAGTNTIYGVDSEGQLKKSDLSRKKLRWKNLGHWDQPVHAIAVAGNKLYLADKEGLFHVADLKARKLKWEKASFFPLEDVISLAGDADRLLALTREGVLYQQGGTYQQGKWIKIGYKNGVTVHEDIKALALAGHQFYGIDSSNRLFQGEHRSRQELSARALSIATADKTVIVVALDLTGINDSFTNMVKNELYKKRALPHSAVFINSSHTHFAPVTQNWPTWQESNRIADSTYLYTVVREAIVKAVEESIDNAKPAELFIGRGSAQLGYNRSLRDHPEIYDNAVDVLRFRYLHDQSEGCLFIAACHPVFSSPEDRFTLSANFPGVARKVIEEKSGITRTLFLQGTAGDINPTDNSEYTTGEKLGNEVMAVLNRPMEKIGGPLTFFLDSVVFDVPVKSRDEILAYTGDEKINANAMLAERNQTWGEIMLDYLKRGTKQFPMPVYVHTLNVGNWKLVGFSRETTTPYSLHVKKMWPGQMVSVTGYTNDVSSYLPTHLHIEKRNYEGMDSFYWYGMPDTYPWNVEEKILTEIKNNNR
jgi:hypothetical protein